MEVSLLPLIDLRHRMIDRSQSFLFSNRGDPFLNRNVVGALQFTQDLCSRVA